MSLRDTYIANNAVDAKWFLELKSINRPLLLKSLEIDSENHLLEKEKFFSDNTYSPAFTYSNLSLRDSSVARERLFRLRELVCQNEPDSSIRSLYSEKIKELILEQSILCAAAEKDANKFTEANIERYGNINTELVGCGNRRPAEEVNLFKESIDKTFEHWPTMTPVVGFFDAEQIQKYWQSALSAVSPHWIVEISDAALYLRVSNKERKVYVPEHLKLDGVRLAALFDHEIGTHVFRREQGKVFPVQLFSIGTAGYELAEEGIALIREYASRGKFGLYGGRDKYQALSFALGAVDGTPHNFRETFEYLRDYYYLRHKKHHGEEEAVQLSKNRAWLSTVRIFRGGDTTVPGCCFYRDKLYREGVHLILKMLGNGAEGMKYADKGKFDPTNINQLAVVEKFSNLG